MPAIPQKRFGSAAWDTIYPSVHKQLIRTLFEAHIVCYSLVITRFIFTIYPFKMTLVSTQLVQCTFFKYLGTKQSHLRLVEVKNSWERDGERESGWVEVGMRSSERMRMGLGTKGRMEIEGWKTKDVKRPEIIVLYY